MTNYPESELVKDFLAGEKKAFDELYDRYYSVLVRFCYSFTKNLEDAKDLTIETLTVLFKKHTDFASLTNIQAFLYITARNNSLNHLKSSQRLSERYRKYFYHAGTDPQDLFMDQVDGELIRLVYLSIQELPPQCKKVMKLLYIDDLRYKEVAAELETTVKNVENLRNYALKKLREKFFVRQVLVTLYFLQVIFLYNLL